MKLTADENIEHKGIELQSLNDPTQSKTTNYEDYGDETIQIHPSKARIFNICELIFAYISLFVLNHPKISCYIVIASLVVIVILVNWHLRNAQDISTIIQHDYSGITSKYDLQLGTIDHWCLGGGDGNCHCSDPLTPEKKENMLWIKAFDENIKDIQTATSNLNSIDIVFLGANIVEYWNGRTLGRASNHFVSRVSNVFNNIFDDGKLNALPLGIAGDTASNILWRLQNGELPDNLRPKIWWLVIGDNDMAIRQCSEEVVLMGILRIVEEILSRIPDAKIVINSILPMTSNPKGRIEKIDVKDIAPHLTGGGDRRIQEVAADDDDDSMLKKEWSKDGNMNIEIGKEAQITSTTGEMKPARSLSSVSLFSSVTAINVALKKFSSHHKHIHFFDSTDIFVEDNKISEDLMISFLKSGQPTIPGHKELLMNIFQEAKDILHKLEELN